MSKRPAGFPLGASLAGALILPILIAPTGIGMATLGARAPRPASPAATLAAMYSTDFIASTDPFAPRAAAVLEELLARAHAAGVPGCIETPLVSAVLDPNTPPERIPELLEWLRRFYQFPQDPSKSSFNRVNRWLQTATDSSTGFEGDPITLTWSIVADGTVIDGGVSNLQSVFDANFPDHATWVDRIRDCFVRWDDRTGVSYIETVDDGAIHPDSAGVLGVRGDVRIGGRNIDGPSNILAYNFFPDTGDMVLDTGDVGSFRSSSNNYRFLRNTVMHEHGHGLGLGHVIPTNGTKLMEAFLNTGFLGQQDDDIRGGQKNYGDTREQNDDSLSATYLGTIADSLRTTFLCLDKGGDVDWYRFTSNGGEAVTVLVDPIGSTYSVGPDGGTATTVKTDSILNLQFALYDAAGNQLAQRDTAGLGGTEILTAFPIPIAADYLIRVFKSGSGGLNALQRYELLIDLDPSLVGVLAAGASGIGSLGLSISPNPVLETTRARFRLGAGSPFALEVFDPSGRLVRSIEGRAPAGGAAEVAWDGTDGRGARLASGVYMLRVRSGALTETQRAVLLR